MNARFTSTGLKKIVGVSLIALAAHASFERRAFAQEPPAVVPAINRPMPAVPAWASSEMIDAQMDVSVVSGHTCRDKAVEASITDLKRILKDFTTQLNHDLGTINYFSEVPPESAHDIQFNGRIVNRANILSKYVEEVKDDIAQLSALKPCVVNPPQFVTPGGGGAPPPGGDPAPHPDPAPQIELPDPPQLPPLQQCPVPKTVEELKAIIASDIRNLASFQEQVTRLTNNVAEYKQELEDLNQKFPPLAGGGRLVAGTDMTQEQVQAEFDRINAAIADANGFIEFYNGRIAEYEANLEAAKKEAEAAGLQVPCDPPGNDPGTTMPGSDTGTRTDGGTHTDGGSRPGGDPQQPVGGSGDQPSHQNDVSKGDSAHGQIISKSKPTKTAKTDPVKNHDMAPLPGGSKPTSGAVEPHPHGSSTGRPRMQADDHRATSHFERVGGTGEGGHNPGFAHSGWHTEGVGGATMHEGGAHGFGHGSEMMSHSGGIGGMRSEGFHGMHSGGGFGGMHMGGMGLLGIAGFLMH